MGVLRKEWSFRKELAFKQFTDAHKHEMLDVHVNGVTGYPLKFNKDLGPTLDNLEKAQKDKKTTDISKLSSKAKEAVIAYRKQVQEAKTLGPLPSKTLLEALTALEKHLP